MILTLIGMSGVGKSYWSSRLATEQGFERICCDDMIGEKLAKKLKLLGVKPDLDSIAKWRGLPYELRYRKNEELQIINEQEVMEEVCKIIENRENENIVIDTSGSLVYISEQVIQRLKDISLVVCIVAEKEQKAELFNDEVIFRRPLVWGKAFQPMENEAKEDTMRRCFVDLIEWRSVQYKNWAEVELPYSDLRGDIKSSDELLEKLKQHI